MDSISTPHSPHRVLIDSMRTLWTLWGVHDCISYSLHRVHVDSMWTLCGILMDSSWSPEGFPESSWSPQTMFHGFHEEYTEYSPWSLCRLHEDSLPYLFN